MISQTLYFFYNNSLLHGHENYRTLIFVVIDFDQEKLERKGGAKFLAFSISLNSIIEMNAPELIFFDRFRRPILSGLVCQLVKLTWGYGLLCWLVN